MVEGDRLLSDYGALSSVEGSNPSPSAPPCLHGSRPITGAITQVIRRDAGMMQDVPQQASRAVPGWLMALAAAACWGWAAAIAKDVFAAIPPARVAQVRALVTAAVLLLGLAVFNRGALRVPRDALASVAAFSACLALVNGTYYLAISRLPVGVAVTIQYMAPILVLFVRRHSVPARLWLAAGIAFAGATLVAGITGGVTGTASGFGFAVGSTIGFAGYLLAGEKVGNRLGSVASVAWGFAGASLLWAFVQPWWAFPLSRIWLPGVAWRVAAVCTGGTVVPFLLMVAALRRVSAGPAGVLSTAEPAFAALFAWLILDEALTGAQAAGLTLVVIGVAAAQASSHETAVTRWGGGGGA